MKKLLAVGAALLAANSLLVVVAIGAVAAVITFWFRLAGMLN